MNRIPHTIHYCWFGKNPLDEKAMKCIESWHRFFPDYEIIQWNEDNFDVRICDFTQKAYADKKWAFVSDVARLQILYDYGGLYFDTDVEVIAPYDDILATDAEGFLGFEKTAQVNTGLGFGAVKGCTLLKDILDIYREIDYSDFKDNLSDIACTVLTTDLLCQHGLILNNCKQRICDFEIYPATYFSPINYYTGTMEKTTFTHSIHWYNASWQSNTDRSNFAKTQKLYRLLGRNTADVLLGISSCIKKEGLWVYLWNRIHKFIVRI